jgi:hypothetical protein
VMLLILTSLTLVYIMVGCSPSDKLGGVELVNALPDTRITGSPPLLTQTEVTVDFSWTGSDPDGRIIGYQWKMTSNSDDGISVHDTLTVDPASGDTINPWFFTEATDTTYIVTADSLGFTQDLNLPVEYQRFFQPHTLFVRAVDDNYAVDPTPAMITFTATTIAPTIRLSSPSVLADSYTTARPLPPTFTVGWSGSDSDFITGVPTKVRHILKKIDFPVTISNSTFFNQYKDELISFSDPGWSDWKPYLPDADDRTETFQLEPDIEERSHYLFAIQAQDTAGAVSLDLSYNTTVHNAYVDTTRTPQLVVREEFLGESASADLIGYRYFDIAQGQRLEFEWIGSADNYGGEIAGYRFGWDVDPDDDQDPRWSSFGNTAEHRRTAKEWDSGLHSLYIECLDTSNQRTLVQWEVSVVTIPLRAERSQLLLVDDVLDYNSDAWPSVANTPLDNDIYRDAFWDEVLDGPGGVYKYESLNHTIDTYYDELEYRVVVDYNVLLWATKMGANNYLHNTFDPVGGRVFNWLESYINDVGNIFMVGEGAMQNFHLVPPAETRTTLWQYPIIYDSTERFEACPGDVNKALGFGERTEEETGETVIVGREKFPYRTMGLSMTSLTIPPNFNGLRRTCAYEGDRAKKCVGTKAIRLNSDFRDNYVDIGAFSDLIMTDRILDWLDSQDEIPPISNKFVYGSRDEIYNFNTSGRSASWAPQYGFDGQPYIEAMWHAYPRYDWWLDLNLANGVMDIPEVNCGPEAIDPKTGRTRLDGVPIGVISFKAHQGGTADVIWGFDPYRFDRDEIKKAIRWVLGEHFDMTME